MRTSQGENAVVTTTGTDDSHSVAPLEIGRKDTVREESAVRVLVADDHPLMVGGLRQAVLAAAPDADIAIAHDFESMVAALDAARQLAANSLTALTKTSP